MKSSVEEMPFLVHLEELRWRIVKSALAITIFAIPCGIYWKNIFDIVMVYPLSYSNPAPKLIYTNPTETVILSFKIALAGGLVFAAPFVFYQLWKFISPGLYGTEKKIVLPVVFASTFCFLSGIGFSYLTLPLVLRFLTGFASDRLDAMFKANDYLGFLLKMTLSFGVVFELPVVSFVLTRMGILTPGFLIKNFRYAIVLIFIIAAILTPPDILSQTVMAVPLLILYGVSIIVSHLVRRARA